LFALVCTCLHLFALVCTCLHLFALVCTCLHLFALVCSHRSSPAERRYVIRLRLAKLRSIAKTYNIDFEAIKNAFGMVFLPKLLAKCGHALRQSGAITSISQVTGGTLVVVVVVVAVFVM